MGEVVTENGIDKHIRYNTQVVSASWSSETNEWTLTAKDKKTGEELVYQTNFLWMCG